MAETHKVMLRGISSAMKTRIARRVRADDMAMKDVLCTIIARYYRVPYDAPGDSTARIVGNSPQIMLELPNELFEMLESDALDAHDSVRNTAVRILADELGVAFKPTGRWVGDTSRRKATRRARAA